MSFLKKITEKNWWFNSVKNFFAETKSIFFELLFSLFFVTIGIFSWIYSKDLDLGLNILAKTLSIVLALTGYFGHMVPLISEHIVPLSISDISG
ncbi:MAG TPA: hypothetical protein VK074_09055 [Fodinibius sp.]|nr:hypothetical protein [Fodinibius sp.]